MTLTACKLCVPKIPDFDNYLCAQNDTIYINGGEEKQVSGSFNRNFKEINTL